MRVLHTFKVHTIEREGGIQRSISDLAASMEHMGVQHDFFTLADDGPWCLEQRQDNLSVYAAKRSGVLWGTDYSLTAGNLFSDRARKADLIHYHLPWPFVHLLDLRVPAQTPRVATYHADICRNPLLKRCYEPLMKRFLRRLDGVISTSQVYQQTSPVLRHLSGDKLHAVELGIRMPTLDVGVARQARTAFTQSLGEGFMLFVGTTRRYKGAQVAVDALVHTTTRLVIAGDCPDRDDLSARAEALGVADRLVFLGWVTDAEKWALLQLCRAVVMPSTLRSEAFGLALLEAAASNRPAITCEIGTATSHVVRDGETGIVVRPNDPLALGEAMERLHAEPQLAAALGRAGNLRYHRYFTADAYAARMQRLYDRILGVEELKPEKRSVGKDSVPDFADRRQGANP